jgi:C4-dicarboxylate-specific signal transduction histidine kinase
MFADRIRGLLPHAERMVAHRYGLCFSALLQAAARTVEDLESSLQDRFGIVPDQARPEPFFARLEDFRKAMADARREWMRLQGPTEPDQPRTVVLEELLAEIKSSLEPCEIVRNAEIKIRSEGATEVLSFSDDIRVVLKELLLGPLSEVSDTRTPVSLCVLLDHLEEAVEVTVKDNLAGIDPAVATSIHEGGRVLPDEGFSRLWGLSVVQHIALRGGGRLKIEPNPNGNVVRYRLPVHA